MPNHDADVLRRIRELEDAVREHNIILAGERGNFGILHKVDILWKLTIGIVCAISGGVGVWLTNLFSKLKWP